MISAQEIHTKIDEAIKAATSGASYSKDNLLAYSVSLQPHFLVWISALLLSSNISQETRAICEENAREEFFGLGDEGCHFLLSREFFRQLGPFETKHYSKSENEIEKIYRNIANTGAILVCLTCIETALSQVTLPKMLDALRGIGVTDFKYIDIHTVADSSDTGHSMKFLNSIVSENLSTGDLDLGLSLFRNLFVSIFS